MNHNPSTMNHQWQSINTRTHTHTHTHAHAHAHAHTHTRAHTLTHTLTHTYTHTQVGGGTPVTARGLHFLDGALCKSVPDPQP